METDVVAPPFAYWWLWAGVCLWGLTYLRRWWRAYRSRSLPPLPPWRTWWAGLRRALLPRDVVYSSLVLVLLVWGLYYVPPVHRRLSWRLHFLATGLRLTLLSPPERVPTPVRAHTLVYVTPTFTPTARPSPTATSTPTPEYTPTPTQTPTPIPSVVRLKPPPRWEPQQLNNCGPSALAMYLNWWGLEKVDQKAIARKLRPAEQDPNVNVEELVYYVQRHAGWLRAIFRVGGTLEQLKRLIAAGFPVLIEVGLEVERRVWYNDDRWAGHYLLLTGYDDARGVFIVQDPLFGLDQEYAYEEIDARWKPFNRVFILVYPAQKEALVKEVLGPYWSMEESRRIALETAQKEIEANPEDAFAWFNLGTNLVYFQQWHRAAQAYDKARELGLPQRMLRYQFGPFFAYFHSWRLEDLQALIEYALEITPQSEEAWIWKGWLHVRLGENDKALRAFCRAYVLNPTFPDVHNGLQYLGASPSVCVGGED